MFECFHMSFVPPPSRSPRKASKHLSIQPSSALLSLTDHFHLAHAPTSQRARIDGLGGDMGGMRGRGVSSSSALPCRQPACDPCPSVLPHCAPLPCPSPQWAVQVVQVGTQAS